MDRLAQVDWVIEAVVEQLDVKRALLERVAAVCRADTRAEHQHVGALDRCHR